MKKADYQLIAYIGIVLGVLFLLGGLWAYYYRGWLGGPEFVYPIKEYGVPLFVGGVALLVIGIAFLWRAREEK